MSIADSAAPQPPAASTLDALPIGRPAVVQAVTPPAVAPEWGPWLDEIGFFPGERVMVMARVKPAVIHVHRGGPVVALVGNPNCGKTALFNLLTGSRQKVANYAGVTVERKEGRLVTPAGRELRLLDLPGAYSLHPR